MPTLEHHMLAGQNIIYFAPEKWNGLWRNRQQLMSIFARQNKVLYVERRYHVRHLVRGYRSGDLDRSDLGFSPLRQISENLYVFRYPIWAPVSHRPPLAKLTQTARRLSLLNALSQLKLTRPLVWFSRPDMLDLLDEIPSPRLVVYHVVDEYAAYGGQGESGRRYVIAAEKAMLSRADLVVVVSPKLYEAKRPLNSETHLVPNGVDYEAYSAALADDHFPDRLAAIKPPRLGYSGLIGDRLDLATLKNLAQAHPDWSVVLLGEARVIEQAQTWQALQELPNVHYLGAVPISEVPYYLKGFQVGLMPYTQTRESEHISPLKLYDYLAAGIPVAAVDIPAVHDFGEHIHVAASAEHFEQAVGKALADTSLAQRKIRRSVAASHTWETRARQISVLLQTRLTTVLPVAG